LSSLEVAIILAVSMAGAVVHGSVGIGLTLVAGPALIAIDPAFAPGPFLLAGQLVGVRHIYAERRHLDREAYRRCVIGFCTLLATDNFGRHEATLSAWLVPGVLAGLAAARWVRPLVDRTWLRPAVLWIALAGGLALVVRQLA